MYNGQELDVDDSFVYLGTMFSYNGRFSENNKHLFDQARKAMFAVLRKSRKLQLPVDNQLQLFDSMVVPILLYGSEVTGFETMIILKDFAYSSTKSYWKLKNQHLTWCYMGSLVDALFQSALNLEWLFFGSEWLMENKIKFQISYTLSY